VKKSHVLAVTELSKSKIEYEVRLVKLKRTRRQLGKRREKLSPKNRTFLFCDYTCYAKKN
jgi:hypothetical protein